MSHSLSDRPSPSLRNIVLLGLVSFFADVSTEMVYPLIPLYLTVQFGATPALVGVIEGIAESVASLLKVYSGHLSDKYQKKKPLAFAGYGAGLIYKLALVAATSWFGILAARVIDRLGKGVRTAPRDVLISESSAKGKLGNAFGLHKALDMAGSALGILIAYLLLANAGGNFSYTFIFWIAVIPAALSLVVLAMVKETAAPRAVEKRPPILTGLKQLDSRLKLYLLVAFVFTLGNSSNIFLLLRAKSVGFDDTSVILLYLIYSLTSALLSIPLGRLSDRVGRKKLLVTGYLTFAAVYAGFAFADTGTVFVVIFLLYGVYTALTAGVERAFIAEIAPPALKGTMLGLHSTIVGVALFPASAIAGLLWTAFGAPAPFLFGAALSLVAAAVLFFLLRAPAPKAA